MYTLHFVYPFICIDSWTSQLWWIMLLWTVVYRYLLETLLSVLFSKAWSKIAGSYSMMSLFFFFWEAFVLLSIVAIPFHIPTKRWTRVPVSPHPASILLFCGFLIVAILMNVRVFSAFYFLLLVGLNCSSFSSFPKEPLSYEFRYFLKIFIYWYKFLFKYRFYCQMSLINYIFIFLSDILILAMCCILGWYLFVLVT